MTASPLAPRPRVTWLDLLAVAFVTFAVFTPVLHGQFGPLDDSIMLTSNPAMTRPSWAGLLSFWTGPQFRIYMPLSLSAWQGIALLSSAVDARYGTLGLLPFGFKLASALAHAMSAAAAAWTLSRLTGTRWPAVAGGLAFALHPLAVESVAWTTGLKDVLCGLFSILAIGCYAAHVDRRVDTPWRDGWWWAALIAAMAATFSKSTALVLPVMLLAVDVTMRRCPLRRRVASLGAFAVPAVGCALIILSAQSSPQVPDAGLAWRPLVAADAYAFYLGKLAWPMGLSVDYGRHPLRALELGALRWTWAIPALLLLGLAIARSRRLWLAAALFVIPVLPTSGLIRFDMQQYSTVTDHYVYQPLLGVGLAVAALVAWRPAVGWAMPLLLTGLSIMTWRQSVAWQVPERLYQDVLGTNPRSWLARDVLMTAALNRGDFRTAGRMADEIDRVNRGDGTMLDNRALMQLWLGQYRDAAELEDRAIKNMTYPLVVPGRRLALLAARLGDLDLAERGVRHWLSVEPGNPFALNMLYAIQRAKTASPRTSNTRPAEF